MKRSSLFFIGLLSAIITFTGLTYAFGKPGYYYDPYPYYNRFHHCYDGYDRRYDNRYNRNQQQQSDSTKSNY